MSKLLVRHRRVSPGGRTSTARRGRRLSGKLFPQAALQSFYNPYRGAFLGRSAEFVALEGTLVPWIEGERFVEAVRRLIWHRGVSYQGGPPLASEAADWCSRNDISNAGPAKLHTPPSEPASTYQHHPILGVELQQRQQGADVASVALSCTCQPRLYNWRHRIRADKDRDNVVSVAVPRHHMAFVWHPNLHRSDRRSTDPFAPTRRASPSRSPPAT